MVLNMTLVLFILILSHISWFIFDGSLDDGDWGRQFYGTILKVDGFGGILELK